MSQIDYCSIKLDVGQLDQHPLSLKCHMENKNKELPEVVKKRLQEERKNNVPSKKKDVDSLGEEMVLMVTVKMFGQSGGKKHQYS
jgi:hypothetical protein